MPVPTSKSKPHRDIFIEFISGWFGGACGIALTHPIDCVRVTKQYHARITKNNQSYYQIIKNIYASHGLAGFRRGIIPPTILRGAGLAANRAGYNIGEQIFEGKQIKGSWRMWVVGSIAGVFTGVVDMPIHLMKCRAQLKLGLTTETFQLYAVMLKRIWKYEGIRAFMNGLIPQLLYTSISYAMFYAMYDYLLSNGFSIFVSGMVAGTLSWPPVLPFDSLRVRMQCQPYNVSLIKVAGDMWRQPMRLWFTGNGATMIRAAPRWGITMFAIENCNRNLINLF